MEGLYICQICKEPIWNFLCIDCLKEDISKWLPTRIAPVFKEFHSNFSSYFRSMTSHGLCMHCKSMKNKPVCPYCYTNEIYHWLKREDSDLASRFMKLFFFDFGGSGFAENVRMDNLVPITGEGEDGKDSGICDECGEYSEELDLKEGSWVCRACMNY